MLKLALNHISKGTRTFTCALLCAFALFATGCSNGFIDFVTEEKPAAETAQTGTPGKTVTASLMVRGAFAEGSRSVRPNATMARYELWGALSGAAQAKLASFTSITGASVKLGQGTWNFTLKAFTTSDATEPVLTASIADKVIAADPVSLAFELAPAATGTGSVSIAFTWPASRSISGISWENDDDGGSLVIDGNGGKLELDDVATGNMLYTFTVFDTTDTLIARYCELVTVAPGMTSSKTVAFTEADFNAKPAAPSNLQATLEPNLVADKVTANFSWTDNSNNEDSFYLWVSTDGTSYSMFIEVSGGITTASFANLVRGSSYWFKAVAYSNITDTSDSSNVVGPVKVPYLVKFDLAGGNVDGATTMAQEIAPDGTISLPTPTKAEYSFVGWFTGSNGMGTQYTADTKVTESVTLYACYGAMVTYDANGATGADVPVDSNVYKYDASANNITVKNIPAGLIKEQDGITLRFLGWNTSASSTGAAYQPGSTAKFERNTVLYAIWSAWGGIGPAGGIVFITSNSGATTTGWNYMEVWTEDEPGTYAWTTNIPDTLITQNGFGDGKENTALMSTGYPAADAARAATHGGKNDWFLPSAVELQRVQSMIYSYNFAPVFNASIDASQKYLTSSTQYNGTGPSYGLWYRDFTKYDSQMVGNRTLSGKVRLVRRF